MSTPGKWLHFKESILTLTMKGYLHHRRFTKQKSRFYLRTMFIMDQFGANTDVQPPTLDHRKRIGTARIHLITRELAHETPNDERCKQTSRDVFVARTTSEVMP